MGYMTDKIVKNLEILKESGNEMITEDLFVAGGINKRAVAAMLAKALPCERAVKKKGLPPEERKKALIKCQMHGLQAANAIYKAEIGKCSKSRNPEKCKEKILRYIKSAEGEIARMKKITR